MTVSPSGMPRLRAELAWRHPRVMRLPDRLPRGPADVDMRPIPWSRARLYWASADMTALALDASADLPPTFDLDLLPTRDGLLYFDRPLPPLPGLLLPPAEWAKDALGRLVPPWAPVQAVHWTFNLDHGIEWVAFQLDDPHPRAVTVGSSSELDVHVIENDGLGKLLWAAWLLMRQPSVAEARELTVKAPPAPRKKGAPTPPRLDVTVEIVDVHPPIRKPAEAGDESGDGREYHHRWVVRGHWRQQPYGRDRALRRPQWIPDHIKGPEGAPLLEREIVWRWRA